MYGEGIPLCLALACEEGSVFKHAEQIFLVELFDNQQRTVGSSYRTSPVGYSFLPVSTAHERTRVSEVRWNCSRLYLGTGKVLYFMEGWIKNSRED